MYVIVLFIYCSYRLVSVPEHTVEAVEDCRMTTGISIELFQA